MEMQSYAVVKNDVVANVVLWDGKTEWAAPADSTLVALSQSDVVGVGYTYDGKIFAAPNNQQQG